MVQLSHYSARAFAICASVLMTSAVSRAEQISQTLNNNPNNGAMAGTFTLPALPYAYDALEPHVDALTMEIHHSKHHQTYVNNLNNLLKGTELANLEIDDLVTRLEELIEQVPAANRTGVRNNAGGHSNHSFFWKQLKVGTTLDGDLKTAIERDFGSVEEFKKQFEKAATSVFGSGWAWLTLHNGTLKVVTTANQDSPLSGKAISGAEGTPIIGLDVWEHAYYLKYQNRRPDYIAAFWSVVNWEYAKQKFAGLSCPSN